MNTAQKIEPSRFPRFRRKSDRAVAVARTYERVEREHSNRMKRMTLVLIAAAALLIVNGIIVTSLV